jgi:hypothetical protein
VFWGGRSARDRVRDSARDRDQRSQNSIAAVPRRETTRKQFAHTWRGAEVTSNKSDQRTPIEHVAAHSRRVLASVGEDNALASRVVLEEIGDIVDFALGVSARRQARATGRRDDGTTGRQGDESRTWPSQAKRRWSAFILFIPLLHPPVIPNARVSSNTAVTAGAEYSPGPPFPT